MLLSKKLCLIEKDFEDHTRYNSLANYLPGKIISFFGEKIQTNEYEFFKIEEREGAEGLYKKLKELCQ